ncbi:hypothetical protein RAC89_23075 [Paenibacillus sp. GD4]|uniref:hypothetical protein n=1 Tax=Paenibacillus sp. GD4 TaxID=3068890 RepID=UPI002796B9E3|nr:hypothetical protein [Paenibacillus sp. GD4]MDQ1913283.1 hypothetical protein [Paenibacillus sp. GD4]
MKLIDEIKAKVTNKVEAYQEIKNRFDAEINRLESEIMAINDAIKATRAIIEEKAMNLEDTSAEEKQIEDATKLIAKLAERLELIKRGKRQALASHVPAVKRHIDEKREEVKKEIEKQVEVIHKLRATLLMEIQKLYEINHKAIALYSEYLTIAEENGENVIGTDTGSIVGGRFHSNDNYAYFGKDITALKLLTVPQWMVQDAKEGNIPITLKKYIQ